MKKLFNAVREEHEKAQNVERSFSSRYSEKRKFIEKLTKRLEKVSEFVAQIGYTLSFGKSLTNSFQNIPEQVLQGFRQFSELHIGLAQKFGSTKECVMYFVGKI